MMYAGSLKSLVDDAGFSKVCKVVTAHPYSVHIRTHANKVKIS